MRLIDEQLYSDHPLNKISICARNIADIYKESGPYQGTQVVFSDIGTPKTEEFNVYEALKQKLVNDFHIPAQEITFIHDWSAKNKKDLFKRMNNGSIRIILGSTEKLGTGTNIQKRGVAEHDLDIPWRPADLDQRGGRLGRQGNEVAKNHYGNKVKRYIYATERSLDNYKFNLLKNKQLFISQMKNNELQVRSIDEGAIDEQGGMNFAEYIAILSGDTSLLEKAKVEKKIAVLESSKKSHHKEVIHAKLRLESLIAERKSDSDILSRLTQDSKYYNERLQFEKDGTKINAIQFNGLKSTEPEKIGQYLIKLYKDWKPGDDPKIGSLYGFDLFIRHHVEPAKDGGDLVMHHYNTFYAERPETGIKYTYNQGHPNIDNPKLAARHFLNAIDRVDSLLQKYNTSLADIGKEIAVIEKIVAKPFEKEQELSSLKIELTRLEREIRIRIKEKQLAEGEPVVDDLKLESEPDQAIKEAVVIQLSSTVVNEPALNYRMPAQQPAMRQRKSRGYKM